MSEAKEVTLVIDGVTIKTTSDTTILDAALANGIYIPHLCSHENLHPEGSCRMCVVGIEGVDGVVTSCTEKCKDGMVVNTKDETAEKIRKLSCDFMFKTHPSECTGCPKFGKCQLASISQYVGDTGRKLKANPINCKEDTTNPIILHEMHRCILCGRCVRVCNEVRGVGVLKFKKVNGRQKVVIDGENLKKGGCRFCTACVEVCPTGSIREYKEIEDARLGKTREEGFVPCRSECPAHVNVPEYIRFINQGNYAAANAVIREKVPFPHALGYICVHNCESACKHHYLNEAVSIRNLKRFAAEHDDGEWKKLAFHKPATGKKIAVIGGGPAGLTVAYYGAKLGHSITIFEAQEKLGGQMRYGIPGYRLPREVVDDEVQTVLEAGDVEVKNNTKVENAPELLKQGYDAVFVSLGTHVGARLPLPGNDLEGVKVNTDFLRDFENGTAEVGEHVVVLGGGNVAIDCTGAAFRLGAKTVDMACLEAYDAMTASDEERSWAEEEGVVLHNSKTFPEIKGENGHCTGVLIQSVGNFRKENGRMVFDKLEGTEEILEADTVIFATGQRPSIPMEEEKFGLALTHGNYVAAQGPDGETSVEGIWAAGDCVTGTRSVIAAIAAARDSIIAIDKYLGGEGNIEEALAPKQFRDPHLGKVENFGDKERTAPRVVPAPKRVAEYKTAGPMDYGFDEEMARCEASRCLQCDLRCDLAPQKFWNDYQGKEKAE
ncbi:MAG: FAD-dependent oxidoreductase [Lachnospiraceae bacterium]|nr:FAD-dependent oxidoreductase [Lachnospiraceae bacterium]